MMPESTRTARPQRGWRIVAALAALVIAWLPGRVFAHGNQADIIIGVIAGLTGPGATYGAGILRGAEMAVRDVNAAGGVNGRKLRLMVVDDGSNPARSAIVMRRLIAASPALIAGGWGSAQVLAHLDFAEQAAIPYIVVGATHSNITSPRNNWIFRVTQTDRIMAQTLARVATTELGLKRIAVMYDSNAYGTGARDHFLAALEGGAGKPVAIETYQASSQDFRPQLQRIKLAAADAIAILGTVPAAPAIMNQARELGISGRFIGLNGLASDALIAAAPAASEGTVLTAGYSKDLSRAEQSWQDDYDIEYKGRPASNLALAALEYRTLREIAIPCLRTTGGNGPALRNCIAAWRGKLFGGDAEAAFDKSGQLLRPTLTLEVRAGAFTLRGPPG